ncbi:MAG: ABC transporter substrate-binding protein [Actinomycetota bacterium]|nr:ABC transporter substrate-binding protein [Actinomycetota bacterium]MDD5665798.1 ABC transporter substrate-binding protein [Actinomycetota bacterium]
MRGKRTLLIIAVAAFVFSALLALPGCGDGETETDSKEPIKVGVVLSESGANEPLGKPERNSIELYVDRLNDAGGIDGHMIEVIIKDDQSDANKAQQAAVELLQQEEVVALIGSSGTGTTIAMKQEATKARVPMVTMAAGANIMDGDFTWIFRTPPTATEAGKKVLEYVSEELGVKRIALLYDTNAFGTDGKAVVESEAADYGLDVVVSEGYVTDESEEGMDTHLTNIMTADPEVVVVWGTNPGPAKIAKRMRDKGIDLPYVGSHGIANQAFIELAGDAANGVVFPAGKMLIFELILEPGSEEYEFIKDYSDAYFEEYGEHIDTFGGHGWDAITIIVEALKRAGTDVTPEELRDEIEATEGLVGTAGIFTYSPTDHNGLSPDDLTMVEIVDSKWEHYSK